MKYTGKGHIVTVELHIPTDSRDEAYSEANAIADEINETEAIHVNDKTATYFGFAQVRGIEEVTFDFDPSGTIIGHHSWDTDEAL